MTTFVGIASYIPQFSILIDTLKYIDANLEGSALVATLNDRHQDLTVFAPTNAAFAQLAADLGYTGNAHDTGAVTNFLVQNVEVATLNAVVTYHVLGTSLDSHEIRNADTLETLQGATIGTGGLPNLVDQEPDLVDPKLIATDIHVSNGILHVIDRVLLPIDLPGNGEPEPQPTIVDIALSSPDFSILVAALQYIDANLEGSDLVGTLANADASLTVFAPNNAAFGQLAADLGFDGDVADTGAVTAFLVANVDVDTLNAVVTYHVSGGAQFAADISAAGSITTVQGGVIGAGELPTLTDLEPDLIDPSLVKTDIEAANGVVHVIDRVLLPVDLAGNDAPSITGIVAASGDGFDSNGADFDILLQAVKTAGLAETLASADVDLTVFAPNDAAFVKLANDLGFNGDDESDAWGYLVDALTLVSKGDPVSLLTDVLTYHVAGQSLQASQVLGLDSIETLQGGSVTVNGASLIDNDPESPDANLIATDIQAENGIVHVIDQVLIPADLLAGDNVEFVIGDDGRDYIRTGSGDDFVSGKGGNDYILLGSGNDVGFGGAGRDLISGWRGDDHIDGGEGNDRLYGGSGNDAVNGGEGHDRIFGGSGDDVIEGGAGRDVMSGGRGSDVFVFNEGDGRDKIRDFNVHQDQIDLSALDIDSFDDLDISGGWFGTHIDLGDGNSIDLSWVREGHLTEDNFIL